MNICQHVEKIVVLKYFIRPQESPAVVLPFSVRLGLCWQNVTVITKAKKSFQVLVSCLEPAKVMLGNRKVAKFLSLVVNTSDVMLTASDNFKLAYTSFPWMDTWYANTLAGKLFGSQKWGWLSESCLGARNEDDCLYAQLQEGCSRGTGMTMLWGHAAKPPGHLSEGTGNCWKPHFQEGDTQKNSTNFNNWHWTPMGPMFWDFVTLYINDKVDLLSWARKIWRILCPFPLVFRAELLLHPTWYWMRQHHLWSGCQVKIWDETL